jgi:hypothetical protein
LRLFTVFVCDFLVVIQQLNYMSIMFYIVQSMNYCENKLFAGVSVDDVLDSSEYELSRSIMVSRAF